MSVIKVKNVELEKVMEEYYELLKQYISEVGHTWTVAKSTEDTVIKTTVPKNGRGSGYTCYQGTRFGTSSDEFSNFTSEFNSKRIN